MQANAQGDLDPFNQMMAYIEMESSKMKEEKNRFVKKEPVPDSN